jgi:hypothetical protein
LASAAAVGGGMTGTAVDTNMLPGCITASIAG